MSRIHFFEIEDQSWCPAGIRNGLTDYLQFAITTANAYAPILARLTAVVRGAGSREVIDLCSGAGGPWLTLEKAIATVDAPVQITLTDVYPNAAAIGRIARLANPGLRYHNAPVDARRVPANLCGTRTLFTSFHHFAPTDARAVLRDAAAAGERIAIFEATQRSVVAVLVTLFSPLIVLLATPAIRPFRWSRLLWTYLVPIIPIAVLFDGIVSCLRTYTPAELVALSEGLDSYRWEAGEERARGPIPVTYLIGTPNDAKIPNCVLSTVLSSQ